jgi:hypothetical protein
MKIFFFIIVFFITYEISAQNLIPNPSFEQYSSCPLNDYETSRLLNWFSPVYPNNMPVSSFFEFGVYNVCSPYFLGINTAAVPQNFGGFEHLFG